MAAIEDDPIGCRVLLHVSPRASRTRVVGLHDGRVKLQVAAPPVDGEANAEVERFLDIAQRLPELTATELAQLTFVAAPGQLPEKGLPGMF